MNSHNKFRFRVIDKSSVDQYLRNKNLDKLRENILGQIREKGLNTVDLVAFAKISNDSANLIKELVISNQIDNTELANQIAREIISKIEIEVDSHLEKYQKFTLNAPELLDSSRESDLKSQFFSLISLLKDVSVLGRRLLEMAPHFSASNQRQSLRSSNSSQNLRRVNSSTTLSINSDTKSIQSGAGGGEKQPSSPLVDGSSKQSLKSFHLHDEDATSEDLLAALIESSSTDDFLILSSSLDTIEIKDMIMASLIYIKSHECFTLSHDIHGVVMVLRRIKFIILNILAPKNQVELITKLLTSIGRYGEMTYVFDLFRDRNQFEVLLSKGVEKTPELRIALFNYVKKNPEYYALVTLNFSMFREIAESLEANALKRLNKIKLARKLGSNSHNNSASTATVHNNNNNNNNNLSSHTKSKTTAINNNNNNINSKLDFFSSTSTTTTTPANNILSQSLQINFEQQHQHQNRDIDRQASLAVSASSSHSSSSSLSTSAIGCTGTPAPLNVTTDRNSFQHQQREELQKPNKSLLYSKEGLNLCLVELADASDCYAKAGCYKKSNNCERKAKLLALQIGLLQDGINVLDIPAESNLTDLISSFSSFEEAFILFDNYDCQLSTWRQALFKQVILEGHLSYLRNYCKKFRQPSNYQQQQQQQQHSSGGALVEEIVLLYNQFMSHNFNQSTKMYDSKELLAKRMQYLISKLTNQVEFKYSLYSQLNFSEAQQNLLNQTDKATQAYLKDHLKLFDSTTTS